MILAAGVLIAVLAAGAIFLSGAMDPFGGRIAENVSAGGISLGGMTKGEAQNLLQDTWQDITLTLPTGALRLTPEESGLKLNTKGLLKQAYAIGRWEEGPTELSLAPYLTLDEAAIRSLLETAAQQLESASAPTSCTLEGELPDLTEDVFSADTPLPTLAVTTAVSSYLLDVDAAWQLIWERCAAGVFEVDLRDAAQALEAEAPDVDAIWEEIALDPVDAKMDLQTKEAIPGVYGVSFDREELEAQLETAAPGETVRVALEATAPQVVGREVYFQDVLGFCQTPHGDNEKRNINLGLACQALNGVVLEPGETLSYNATLGQRTEEAGYQAAPAYSGTQLINTLGGGICQVSSTLYLCSLYAGLETVERVSHGYPASYMPIGLDATVSWEEPDLKIRNDSDYPVKIVAETTEEFVYVWIMGTETRDYYIRMGFSSSTDRYAKSYICKYDRETGEQISREDHLFSAYLSNSESMAGEIGSDEIYSFGNVRQQGISSPSQETLEASRNYQAPNTRG